MGELSILTIVVSLAVCSILVVALYQYVNQRLSFAEQSQKEQATILQQYIEESSYDIHHLKQFMMYQRLRRENTTDTTTNGGGHNHDDHDYHNDSYTIHHQSSNHANYTDTLTKLPHIDR